MFEWKNKYYWDFSEAGRSDMDTGPAVTGSKMFRGGKFKNVVRETAQNSADAKDPDLPIELPVIITYEYIEVERNDIPGIDRLNSVIDMGYDYLRKKGSVKLDDMEIIKKANDTVFKSLSSIPVLKISDFNTTGLTPKDYDALLMSEGITYKTETEQDTSGSFGYGKYAPYLLSPVNTVLYATYTTDNQYLFQGRAFLSTFAENGRRKKGMTLFGHATDDDLRMLPITDQNDVPTIFRRTQPGTDIYILCFEKSEDWLDQIVFNALENFFYAIHQKKVQFLVKDGNTVIDLNETTLPSLMKTYTQKYTDRFGEEIGEFTFTAPKYWKVLNDDRTIFCKKEDFRKKGEVLLYILMGDEIEGRSVLQMRSTGMKIFEATDNFNRLPPFNGILIATARGREKKSYLENISKFLREMESPSHNSWLLEDVKKNEIKNEARLVLQQLHDWIREEVKKQLPKDDGQPVDVFGLSKILPNIKDEGEKTMEEEAWFNVVPLTVTPKNTKKRKQKSKKIPSVTPPTPNPNPTPNPAPNPTPNPTPNPKPKHDRREIHPVRLSSIRTPYLETQEMYKISFIPEKSANPLMLRIMVVGDSSSTFDVRVINAKSHEHQVRMSDEYILISNVKEGERVQCDITLSESEKYALEVIAYAK